MAGGYRRPNATAATRTSRGRRPPLPLLLLLGLAALARADESDTAQPETPGAASADGDARVPSDVPAVDASSGEATALYEAYNQLHTLAQQFSMPIDSPAIVVIGRQTDGKSALVEALMGFQFNHVGGGTKTRKPIALQMQYHAGRESPQCYLQTLDGERPLSLADLQAHIRRENERLEAELAFESSEIIVRIEYKYAPNLIIIDTPGLLPTVEAPTADTEGGDDAARAVANDPQLAAQARAVEELVGGMIKPEGHVILCVEETSSWQYSPARAVVQRADPSFARTVVVSTKLDTKFAQFGHVDELRAFLLASQLRSAHPRLLGGPYFTSVPAGRVGSSAQHAYRDNDGFRAALATQESADRAYVSALLGGAGPELADALGLDGLGLSRLKSFLEEMLRGKYLTNLQCIVPQLQCALDRARSQLAATDASLDDLTPARLRALCSRAAGRFTSALELAIGGSARPEARGLGQTLADEYRDGAGPLLPKSAQAVHVEVDGAGAKLFGGAQYHRLLRELHVATRALPPVAVSAEDVANALGVGAQHDSLHVGRAVCQIALHRSAKQLHDVLRALFERLRYIMGRMLLFVQAVCAADALGDRDPLARLGGRRPDTAEFADKFAEGGDADEDGTAALEKLLEPMLWRALADAYADQLGECLDSCADVCMRDLRAIAATDGGPLPDVSALYPLLSRVGTLSDRLTDTQSKPARRRRGRDRAAERASERSDDDEIADVAEWAPRGWYEGSGAVDALAQHVVGLWRKQFVQAVQRKVHSLFLLRLSEELPAALTHALHALCDPESMRGLDLGETRAQLVARRERLILEQEQAAQVLKTFHRVRTRLGASRPLKAAMPSARAASAISRS